ncbi:MULTISPECIES: diaminopimelate decarboxylase [Halolamina]|uniref:Diaminopimelate decarboxylase n=1 Tax=Halolamina pelagica TaxID=699431 RepID=A0A1I5NL03_9EURY|nr:MULTISPECIES: diaminopimelate decarboxylase [Halolamina]NHX36346.1 diaminopimelate decarboxylase [Halolamina sp. R1-12]SFP21911.1 diaminopimelate decarboxylase [Halolamina pelagica]
MSHEDHSPTGVDERPDGGPAVRRLADWDRETLEELAAEHGTPLYAFDPARVRENCRRLHGAFPGADIQYAAKAHTARRTLKAVHDEGLGIESASAGEVRRALDAGIPGADVTYTAVNPPAQDLDAVVAAWRSHPDLTITAGAADTIDRLAERGFDGRLRLRVNPGVGAGHHEKVVTGGHPKFGVALDRAPDLAARAAEAFEFAGIHAHAGSGISGEDLADHRELVRRMGELARELEADGIPVETVDVGGGFGVPYREDAPPLDLDAVAEATREALGEVDATLAIEPGRYVVADAGVLLTRVNTVKEALGTVVAGVDAGMTTLLRPAMYDAYHAVRNLGGDTSGREQVGVTVAGPVCETADLLCENRPLPRPERGDLLTVGNAGAYGYEMASTYNSRPRPAEVTVDGDLLRRRETLADVSRLDAPGESSRRSDEREP